MLKEKILTVQKSCVARRVGFNYPLVTGFHSNTWTVLLLAISFFLGKNQAPLVAHRFTSPPSEIC